MTISLKAVRETWRRGAVKYLLALCVAGAALTLYLLARASANTDLFAQNYPLLLAVNGVLVACLVLLLGYQLWTLRRKLRAHVFGSRLTLRLLLLFTLIAVLPGALVYAVSVQFVAKSIESWFDVRVEKALEGGLNLGRSTLDNQLKELAKKADAMAFALASQAPHEHLALLNTLREQSGVQEAVLFNMRGEVIAFSSSGTPAALTPGVPDPSIFSQLRLQRGYSAIESAPDQSLYLRVLVPVDMLSMAEDMRVLQLLQPVPPELARDAEIVQTGQREYQELMLARQGLRRLYGLTLTLTLLIAVLSALSLAFVLSERLSAPLSYLAEGTRAVAQGDFSPREFAASRDEFGMLTQSFNTMRQQLAEARGIAERNQAQLAHAHAYVQGVLINLSAGVLAFDEELRLRSFNRSASELLGTDFSRLTGTALDQWHAPQLGALVREITARLRANAAPEWETQIERARANGMQTLLVRGARLPAGTGTGLVVVFDDITHVLQAQRDAAWSEVARRLAHEIKNPLTPIQLSAERLQVKLAGKLSGAAAEMLTRSTQTIINQVSALKRMVDAFRQYARMPELALQQVDFNALLREVLTLYETGNIVRTELESRLPPIAGDPARLRQVIHNLLQNAQDALSGAEQPRIVVRSESADNMLRITITDNGGGFPEQLIRHAFEPYVTTKPKGTGLGLVIVKKIVEEHGGTVRIENVLPRGARVILLLPFAAARRAEEETAANA